MADWVIEARDLTKVYMMGEVEVHALCGLTASSDLMSEVLSGELQLGDLIVLNPPVVFNQTAQPPFVQQR